MVAPIPMVGVSAAVIFPCTIKSRRFLLALADLGSPGKRVVKQLYVCFVNESLTRNVGQCPT